MPTFRLVHIGVAGMLTAAAITGLGLAREVGAAGNGSPSSFVPIVPCRLADTRPGTDHVGTRATGLGAGEAVNFAVWGTNGNCTVPSTATGIATNVTAVNASSASYVTIYPADASPRPTASNLNVVAGGAPTPNQVTVGLSATGSIGAYNNGGTIDLVVDIVGYYVPASTGSGTGTGGTPTPQRNLDGSVTVSAFGYVTNTPGSATYFGSKQCVGLSVAADTIGYLPIQLPNGAQITSVVVNYRDDSSGYIQFQLLVSAPGFPSAPASDVTNSTTSSSTKTLSLLGTVVPVSATSTYVLQINTFGAVAPAITFCDAVVTYTLA